VASDLLPSTPLEASLLLTAKITLLVLTIATMTLVARDTLAHYKFVAHDVGELEERVAHQESQPANLRKEKDYVPND